MNLPSGPQRGYIMLILLVLDLQIQSLDLYSVLLALMVSLLLFIICVLFDGRSYIIGLRVRKSINEYNFRTSFMVKRKLSGRFSTRSPAICSLGRR